MALSKTFVRPVKPNNISDFVLGAETNHAAFTAPDINASPFTPGKLVWFNSSGNLELADAASITGADPVFMVWTDGSRDDAVSNVLSYTLDGSDRKVDLTAASRTRYSLLMVCQGGLICDIASSLFTNTPASAANVDDAAVAAGMLVALVNTGESNITANTDDGKLMPIAAADAAQILEPLSGDPSAYSGTGKNRVVGRVLKLNSRTYNGTTYHRVAFQ